MTVSLVALICYRDINLQQQNIGIEGGDGVVVVMVASIRVTMDTEGQGRQKGKEGTYSTYLQIEKHIIRLHME